MPLIPLEPDNAIDNSHLRGDFFLPTYSKASGDALWTWVNLKAGLPKNHWQIAEGRLLSGPFKSPTSEQMASIASISDYCNFTSDTYTLAKKYQKILVTSALHFWGPLNAHQSHQSPLWLLGDAVGTRWQGNGPW